jgi:hypothetical protein
MDVEEKYPKRALYKLTLYTIKIIPMLLAACALVNTVFSFYGIRADVLSMVGGVSFLDLAFLYLASFVFRFCIYHRMFLHYVLVTDILNITDFYIGIPLDNRMLFGMYIAISGIFLFIILYLYM